MLGLAVKLLMKLGPAIVGDSGARPRFRQLQAIAPDLECLALVGAATGGSSSHFGRDPQRNAMQPARDRIAPLDRAGPAG